MKKWILSIAVMAMFSGLTFGQLIDEKNVTITMDLQPVLQLHMTTPDHIDFIFDDIRDYYAGITKYGATILKVSSSVSWDLYAVGISQAGTRFWDQQIVYNGGSSTSASDNIPLSALELHQRLPNAYSAGAAGGIAVDYSEPFQIIEENAGVYEAALPGQNSIYVHTDPYERPAATQKYIQGHHASGAANSAPGGSYLTEVGMDSDYYFVIDYRILPGLPAIFPCAGTNIAAGSEVMANYAQSGVYTMNVKYVLLEDQ